MTSGLRTMAVDWGARRIGIAISDDGGRLATPGPVLQVSSPDLARQAVRQQIQQHAPARLLVGVPLNMDDSYGPAARHAIAWGRELSRLAGIPVIFVDERLSSFAAEQSVMDRKRGGERLTRQKKKRRLDAIAAASFLQAFLDGGLPPLNIDDV